MQTDANGEGQGLLAVARKVNPAAAIVSPKVVLDAARHDDDDECGCERLDNGECGCISDRIARGEVPG